MLYYNQSPYFQWFLTSAKKQRSRMEDKNMSAHQTGKSNTSNPKPFTE